MTGKNEQAGWALITGASDGIGRAFAVELAAKGYRCILVARRKDALTALAEEIGADRCHILAEDLSDPDAIQRIADATANLPIAMLVAAAGYGTTGPFVATKIEDELGMIDVNCRAVAALVHVIGQRMIAQRSGGIILFSSLVAFQGVPGMANYAATKAYIQTLAEGLRIEFLPHGVDVLSIAPGPIATGFAARAGMTMAISQTPDVVARQGLAALGRQMTLRPGWLAKLMIGSLSTLPRWARVKMLAKITEGMIRK